MKISSTFKAILLGISLSIVTACTGSSNKNSHESDYDEDGQPFSSTAITFNGEEYEILPVQWIVDSLYFEEFLKDKLGYYEKQSPNMYITYPLKQSVNWIYGPCFAFKDKHGNYLRFDNDEDYSDLLLIPFLMDGFLRGNSNNDNVEVVAIVKELCDSFNIPYEKMEMGYWKSLKDYDTSEVKQALETHYNDRIKDSYSALINSIALYFNHRPEEIELDTFNQIEKFVYDNGHPENKCSFSKKLYGYNWQMYMTLHAPLCCRDGFTLRPVENHKFITLTGEYVPKGSLIVGSYY
ncbi:MAG: hypothetical protein HDR89_07090 [Bacteroides sp.]|nr:hypothetical protein [Bacteroides sp.]MBD5350629.1 hypothetical protein [Bacteroides sp.]MBD5422756.1 hypothetical protein [Bacteroides sp.]